MMRMYEVDLATALQYAEYADTGSAVGAYMLVPIIGDTTVDEIKASPAFAVIKYEDTAQEPQEAPQEASWDEVEEVSKPAEKEPEETRKGLTKRTPQGVIDKIITLYRAGWKVSAIAADTKVSDATARTYIDLWLKEHPPGKEAFCDDLG